MVDVSAPDSGSSWNLNQTRENYDKQKQEIKEKYDDDLESLRDKYDQKVHDEEKSGEAAVNHIRQQNRQKTESVQRESEENEKASANQYAVRQENLKRTQDSREAYVEQAKKRQAAWSQAQEQQLGAEKDRVSERTENELKNVRDTSVRRVNEANKRTNEDTQKITDQGKERLQQTRQDYEKRLASMDERERDRYELVRQSHAQEIEQESRGYHDSLLKEKQGHSEEMARLQKENATDQVHMQTKIRHDVDFQRDQGEKRLRTAQTMHDGEIKNEKERYEKTRSAMENKDRTEIDRLNTQAQKEEGDVKTRHDKDIKRENSEYSFQSQKLKERHEGQREAQTTRQKKEYEDSQTAHQQRMDGEQMDFERRYAENEEMARDTYANQGLTLGKELITQKQKFLKAADKYKDRAHDPFYQIRDNKTKFYETPGAYVFKAAVPERDRDNVHVRVKNDRVILTGNRHFNDEIVNEDRTVRTNNVQTFNEEYAIPKKIRENEIIKDYRDGILTVVIPKVT